MRRYWSISIDRSLFSFVDKALDALFAGTLELVNLLAVLVELESRHALDSGGLGSLTVGVDINLPHGDRIGVLASHALEDWTDSLARWAPAGSEVDDEGLLRGGGDSGIVIGL